MSQAGAMEAGRGWAGKALALLVSGAAFASLAFVGVSARDENLALAPDPSVVRVSSSPKVGAAPLDLAGPVMARVVAATAQGTASPAVEGAPTPSAEAGDTYEPPEGTVLVPEVKRMRVSDAREMLEAYGLRVAVRDTWGEGVGRSEEGFFRVSTQSPRLNQRVPEGTVVRLRARPVGRYGQGY